MAMSHVRSSAQIAHASTACSRQRLAVLQPTGACPLPLPTVSAVNHFLHVAGRMCRAAHTSSTALQIHTSQQAATHTSKHTRRSNCVSNRTHSISTRAHTQAACFHGHPHPLNPPLAGFHLLPLLASPIISPSQQKPVCTPCYANLQSWLAAAVGGAARLHPGAAGTGWGARRCSSIPQLPPQPPLQSRHSCHCPPRCCRWALCRGGAKGSPYRVRPRWCTTAACQARGGCSVEAAGWGAACEASACQGDTQQKG